MVVCDAFTPALWRLTVGFGFFLTDVIFQLLWCFFGRSVQWLVVSTLLFLFILGTFQIVVLVMSNACAIFHHLLNFKMVCISPIDICLIKTI